MFCGSLTVKNALDLKEKRKGAILFTLHTPRLSTVCPLTTDVAVLGSLNRIVCGVVTVVIGNVRPRSTSVISTKSRRRPAEPDKSSQIGRASCRERVKKWRVDE